MQKIQKAFRAFETGEGRNTRYAVVQFHPLSNTQCTYTLAARSTVFQYALDAYNSGCGWGRVFCRVRTFY
jgi:hypothetical protein